MSERGNYLWMLLHNCATPEGARAITAETERYYEQVVDMFDRFRWPGTSVLRFTYRNHRGVIAERSVAPIRVYFGSSEHHPSPQWLMDAHDFDRDAVRTFAMRDIEGMR